MWTPAQLAATHWPQITSPPEFFMQRENTAFRARTTTGPHALRLHRAGYHSPQALQSELDLMAMLAGQGMRVPTLAPSASGGFLVPLAGQQASLLSWLTGTPMGLSGEPLALTGPARATLDTAPPQDIGLIHADLVNENVLIDGPDVHFIDFDDSGTGYRLLDLATTLYKAADEPDFPALHQALLSGYATQRPLPDLPLFIVLRSLTYIGWVATRTDTPSLSTRSDRYLTLANRMIDRYLT